MGNQVGGRRRRRPAVEERYTRPQGLYPHPDIDLKKLRRLIVEAKLAPCFPGSDDPRADLEECPICFLFYPSLNRSKCCAKGICTECFLQMRTPTSCRPTQCPYCKMASYAVEYRGVKTKEEKGTEQIEEQRVIEAQIRMRQQELQDDAERMKKKQAAALTDVVTTAQVEHCDTGGASTTVKSSGQGSDMLSSQVQHAELLLKTSERLKQMRNNNFDMDPDEVMLVEALWLSLQDQEASGNPTCGNTVSSVHPPRSFEGSMTIPAEAASSSSAFACAVAALAEQQQMYGEASSTATCHTSRCDILSRSDRSFTEDLSINGSGSSGARSEEPSSNKMHQTREGMEYSNERWSEMAEASSSFTGSDLTTEAGAANSGGSDTGAGSIPDSFEEQMMLAMALSLADARAKASSPGLTWR
ncbi:E3 ubiquitin-protein ligase GW2 [Oryza sativa Japonica Group]|uniref:RING-type domain-containing protein n=3 Tax=Oryza TaxID=4527 RepID=A0A0E0PTQ0_ORYRU|nr:E3 ubiquitin-protein ligase GW2 [Oryza sativa Japonica Group]EEC80040.1 hypothetical protein OsI_21729 [Oryza sativa Indica Group]